MPLEEQHRYARPSGNYSPPLNFGSWGGGIGSPSINDIVARTAANEEFVSLGDNSFKGLRPQAPQRELSFPLRELEEIFAKLLQRWSISFQDAGSILSGSATPTAARHAERVAAGRDRLTADEKDRAVELFKIYQLTHSLFREEAVERAFLGEFQARIGASPLDLIRSGSWPRLIKARQFIEALSGL